MLDSLESLEDIIKEVLSKSEVESSLGYNHNQIARNIVKVILKSTISKLKDENDYLEYRYGDIE